MSSELLLDRYAWEIKGTGRFTLKPGEEDGLEAEARLLQNSERIMKAVDSSYQQLDEDDSFASSASARPASGMRHATTAVWRRWQSVLTVPGSAWTIAARS